MRARPPAARITSALQSNRRSRCRPAQGHAADRYRQSRLFPQGGGLPVGVPGAHTSPRIHPPDRRRPLFRRLPAELGIECLSRHSRPHLRSAVRTGVPARAGRGKQWRETGAGCDLPTEACRRRFQGRHSRAIAATGCTEKRQAHRLHRRGPGVVDAGARSCAARLPRHHLRIRRKSRRLHAHVCRASACRRK